MFEIVGIIGEMSHLAQIGGVVTLCGAGITAAWGAKKLFWIGKVGCKDCRHELGRQTKATQQETPCGDFLQEKK